MSSLVEMIAALAAVASMALQYWLSSAPARAERNRRRENLRIHNEIATGDVAALRHRLRRLRAESR